MKAAVKRQEKTNFTLSCKVCKDAGRPYQGHAVRNRQGKITCPILLSQKCNYCQQPGHTPKYCKQKKREENNKEKRENSTQKPPLAIKKPINMFDVLDCDAVEVSPRHMSPVKKLKPKPLLWSEWESDEEYED
jgi:hypothetical protein